MMEVSDQINEIKIISASKDDRPTVPARDRTSHRRDDRDRFYDRPLWAGTSSQSNGRDQSHDHRRPDGPSRMEKVARRRSAELIREAETCKAKAVLPKGNHLNLIHNNLTPNRRE